MSRRWLSWVVGLALTLASLIIPAAGAQSDPATLTIHWRSCVPGVFAPSLYEACHHLAPSRSVTVSLSGAETRTAATDSAGNVTFSALTPGAYFIRDDALYGDFTGRFVFCAAANAPGIPRPAGLGAIMLGSSDNVICDWYITNPPMSGTAETEPPPTPTPPPPLPSGTTLTIASWVCENDYVNSDFAAMCRATPAPGFRFNIGGPRSDWVTSDAEGIVQFDLAGLPIRRITMLEDESAEISRWHAVVPDCTAGDMPIHARPVMTLSNYHVVVMPVAPSEQIRCDWYHIPFPGA